ncbi:OmpH family outer membrane protein [Bacteroidota bacterium]
MKKLAIIITLMVFYTGISVAQKFAFVDTDYILGNIPAYTAAQEKLDKFSDDWQKEIEALYKEIEDLYKSYQTDKIFLSEEMKTKRENDIIEKEKNAKEVQKKYFGPEGELFKKRQELVKPIQDEIYNAITEISAEGSYAVIFDTAAGLSLLYTNPKYDLSDEILQKLGYKSQ